MQREFGQALVLLAGILLPVLYTTGMLPVLYTTGIMLWLKRRG